MGNPTFYNSATEWIGDNTIDLDADTFHVQLQTSSYTIDRDHDFRNDLSATEVSGTGYVTGGVALTGVTWTRVTGANGYSWFDFDDPTWSNATIALIRYAVLLKWRGGLASADELVCVWDLGQNYSPSGTEFKLVVPATGAFIHRGI